MHRAGLPHLQVPRPRLKTVSQPSSVEPTGTKSGNMEGCCVFTDPPPPPCRQTDGRTAAVQPVSFKGQGWVDHPCGSPCRPWGVGVSGACENFIQHMSMTKSDRNLTASALVHVTDGREPGERAEGAGQRDGLAGLWRGRSQASLWRWRGAAGEAASPRWAGGRERTVSWHLEGKRFLTVSG